MAGCRSTRRRARALAVLAVVVVGLLVVRADRSDRPGGAEVAGREPSGAGPGGAMAGLSLDGLQDEEARDRLVRAADREVDRVAEPRQPLESDSVDDPFVDDALAAYTLALAGHAVDDDRYRNAAAAIVEAWVSTTRSTRGACPDSGRCQTSLVLSRAAPGLVYAADLLHADRHLSDHQQARFRRWLRTVVLPAASDRDNNWGDAGTYLRTVVALELGDRDELRGALAQWQHGIDLVRPDGRIPEEVRRGEDGLMYTQEALSYKVAVADLASRSGDDLWDAEGRAGGSLRGALELAATHLLDEDLDWPWYDGELRRPPPAPMWVLVAQRWPDDPRFAELARRAGRRDGTGHSAVIWTAATTGG